MKLVLLGTGSPEADPRRASSGALVETQGATIMVDCGGGVVDRLLAGGRRPTDVDHLLLTHLHSDHMLDAARLIHARWDAGAPDLPIAGPAPTATVIERLFGREGALAFDLIARTEHEASRAVWRSRGGAEPRPWPAPRVAEIADGATIAPTEAGLWRARACAVPHAEPQLDCLAYRVEAEGGSIVFSGDAGPSDAFEVFAAGADVLVHWCYRWSWSTGHPAVDQRAPGHREIADLAARAGVGRLILTHLRPEMDAPDDCARALAEARARFSGDVRIGEDLMEIVL